MAEMVKPKVRSKQRQTKKAPSVVNDVSKKENIEVEKPLVKTEVVHRSTEISDSTIHVEVSSNKKAPSVVNDVSKKENIEVEKPLVKTEVVHRSTEISDSTIHVEAQVPVQPIVVGIEAVTLDPRCHEKALKVTVDAAEAANSSSIVKCESHTYSIDLGENEYFAASAELQNIIADQSKVTSPIVDIKPILVTKEIVKENHATAEESPLATIQQLIKGISVQNEITESLKPFTDEEKLQLFSNEETRECNQFIENFIGSNQPRPGRFFKLLSQYAQCLVDITVNEKLADELLREADLYKSEVWTVWPDVEISERKRCRDNKELVFSHKYQSARLNEGTRQLLMSALYRFKNHVLQKQLPNIMELEICKLKIDAYLAEVALSCKLFTKVSLETQVRIQSPPSDSFEAKCISDLCLAIEALFHFIRNLQHERHGEFIKSAKGWLSDLIALLVRIGSWREHLFILSHILRCPTGVGDWAAEFVQCPNDAVYHALTVLNVILSPIANRDNFMMEVLQPNVWVLVDDEGEMNESGALKESDITALLNQIPLKVVLEPYLVSDCRNISGHSIMLLLALLSSIVASIKSGLTTYSSEGYKQLRKHLGKLCRELVEVATEQMDLLAEIGGITDRIQVEYDAFFLKAAKCIHGAPSAWQFLAGAPFHRISLSAKWSLYAFLQLTETDMIDMVQFEDEFCNVPEDEKFYLLSTLCNMVAANSDLPLKLVRCITLQIFYVGFLSAQTCDFFYKSASSLLSSIIDMYPMLISELVAIHDYYFDNGVEDQSYATTLWQQLNLDTWAPNSMDFDILKKWVMHDFHKSKHNLARTILKLLNYEICSFEHFRDLSFVLVQSTALPNSDAALSDWISRYFCRVPLHLVDRFEDATERTEALTQVPDLATLAELGRLVDEGNPVACFAALLCTNVGHSVPVIYQQGFSLIKVLLASRKYEAAFLCLENMTVMFWDCPDSLMSCPDFISILTDVISYGNTYLKMAKHLLVSEFPVLKTFALMLYHHLNRAKPEKLVQAIRIWVNSLTRCPMWHDNVAATFLLDIICRCAFFHAEAWLCVVEALETSLNTCASPSEPKSPLSSLMKWVSSAPPVKTLFRSSGTGDIPWLSYAIICVEFEVLEKRTTLWNSLLQDLWKEGDNRGKICLYSSLKRTCSALNLSQRSPNHLALYRWAYLASVLPVTHPLYLLIWHKFMELYLARVPGLAERGCVGHDFFQQSPFKAMKKELLSKLKNVDQSHSKLSKLCLNAFSLWLEDLKLMAPFFNPSLVPAQYCPNLLIALFQGDQQPWTLLLPSETLEKDWCADAAHWNKVLGKIKKTPKSTVRQAAVIKKQVKSCLIDLDVPLTAPKVKIWPRKKVITLIGFDSFRCIFQEFSEALAEIKKYCNRQRFLFKGLEEILLNTNEYIGNLYSGHAASVTLYKKCDGKRSVDGPWRPCSGCAPITLAFVRWDLNNGNQRKLIVAENEIIATVASAKCHGTERIAEKCHLIFNVSRRLQSELNGLQMIDKSTLSKNALALFLTLLKEWDDDFMKCPAISSCLALCLQMLGKCCQGVLAITMRTFFNYLSTDPSLSFLHHLFHPHRASDEDFLAMYNLALTSPVRLLSAFDVEGWLKNVPSLHLRSQLLTILMENLNHTSLETEIMNHHLCLLIRFNFPEQFEEIFTAIVAQSRVQIIPVSTVYALLEAFNIDTNQMLKNGTLDVKKIGACLKQYAIEQRMITNASTFQYIASLTSIFQTQRDANGVVNLYEIYRNHALPFFVFFGMISHGLIKQTFDERPEKIVSQQIEELWPTIISQFQPWLPPSKCLLLFEDANSRLAKSCSTIFVECIRFFTQSAPGAEIVLNYTWKFYAGNISMTDSNDSGLSVFHSCLTELQWNQFSPTLADLEIMLQMLVRIYPHSSLFIGHLFTSIEWNAVVEKSIANYGSEINSRLQTCLLTLLVRLSVESPVKNKEKVQKIIENALSYPWHLVDAANYSSVVTWLRATADPMAAVDDFLNDGTDLNVSAIRLLRKAAGYDTDIKYFHPTTPAKRQMFVAMIVKYVASAQSQKTPRIQREQLKKALSKILTDMDAVITATVPESERFQEVSQLLCEALKLLGEFELAAVVEDCLIAWLLNTNSRLIIVGLLLSAGLTIQNPTQYAKIVEVALDRHFAAGSTSWEEIIPIVAPHQITSLTSTLISNCSFLTLFLHFRQQLGPNILGPLTRSILNTLMQLFSTVKPSADSEPKLILLLGLTIHLISTQSDVISLLETLTDSLLALAAERQSGLLSTLGLKKGCTISIGFKLCCLICAAGISNLLLTEYDHVTDDRAASALERAESNKAYQSVLGHLFAMKNALPSITTGTHLVCLMYNLAAQLYSKLYLIVS